MLYYTQKRKPAETGSRAAISLSALEKERKMFKLDFDISRLQSYTAQVLCKSLELAKRGIPREVMCHRGFTENPLENQLAALGNLTLQLTYKLVTNKDEYQYGCFSLSEENEGQLSGKISLFIDAQPAGVYDWSINEREGTLEVRETS